MSNGLLAGDGLSALPARSWWKDKHYYVRRYGDIFSTGMSRKWDTRVYIDLFSGPGRAIVDEPREEINGSPLIALGQRRGFTHYFFADVNPTYVEALKQRVGQLSPSADVRYYVADCNDAAAQISRDLPAGRGWLGLAFVDPYKWEVSLDSIRELTKNDRRLDLMITLQIANMVRCADNNPAELAPFFGGPRWHAEYLKRRQAGVRRGRVLLELYEYALGSLGYPIINDRVLVKRPSGHIMYYLIFASRNPRGKKFWLEISRLTPQGQAPLFELD